MAYRLNAPVLGDGVVLTTGNSSSGGSPFDTEQGTTGLITGSTATGGYSYRCLASNTAVHAFDFLDTAADSAAFSAEIYIDVPGNGGDIMTIRSASGNMMKAQIVVTSSQPYVRFTNSAGSSLYTAVSALPSTGAGWVRVDTAATKGADATHGRIQGQYALPQSSTPIETGYDSSSVNTGTNQQATIKRWGKLTSGSTMGIHFRNIQANNGSATLLGPVIVPISITSVTATPATFFDGRSTVLSVATANGAGSKTYAWTVTGPSTSSAQFSSTTAATPTFTPAGGPGAYTVSVTVTDTSGSASGSTTVTDNAYTGPLVFNGTSWVRAQALAWNGSQWVAASTPLN